jgi:hypothetical protein
MLPASEILPHLPAFGFDANRSLAVYRSLIENGVLPKSGGPKASLRWATGARMMFSRCFACLNPMLAEDAKAAGLPTNVGYFSSFGDKQNLTPKPGMRDWYKMESVDLGNGGSAGNLNFLSSDSVGVVTQWEWPTDRSFVDGV